MHPQFKSKKYDIAVVVPCYDEWIGVLDTIYSAAIEAWKVASNIAIFLVVNNSLDPDEEILQSNKQTAKLVIDILNNNHLGHKKVSWYDYQQRLKIKKIRGLDIDVWLVDCYTPRNAPEVCNVWYARNIGTHSILSFLEDESSIIAHTDADCKLLKWYFQRMEESYFFWENNVEISTWERRFIFENSQLETRKQITWIEEIEADLSMFGKNHLDSLWNKKIRTNFTPGSHMHFTKKVFQEVWWFENMAWAEDVTFGMNAQKLWYEIHRINSWIDTLCRPSDRTEEWHGFWFAIMRKWYHDKYKTLIDGPFYNAILNASIEVFQQCHESDDFAETLFDSDMNNVFNRSELSVFSDIYEKYMWGEEMKKYSIIEILPYLLATLRQELRNKYPMKPLPDIINEANTIIDTDETFKKFAKRMGVPDISNIEFNLSWNDEDRDAILESYCESGKQKIHAYILLKKTIDFLRCFVFEIENLKETSDWRDIDLWERYASPQEIYIEMFVFVKKYWTKIFCNLTVNISGWETLEKTVMLVEKMFSDGNIDDAYMVKISDLDDLLLSLNENYWCNFPSLRDTFNMKDFLRQFKLSKTTPEWDLQIKKISHSQKLIRRSAMKLRKLKTGSSNS